MKKCPVYYSDLDVIDDSYFTFERLQQWRLLFVDVYKSILAGMERKIDNSFPIGFFLDLSLLDEVVIDAVIGLKKVSCVANNTVEEPNAFKVAAYLTYWWLRHKPVAVHTEGDYHLNDVVLSSEVVRSAESVEEVQKRTAWQLKHINECVAVEFAISYIFNLENNVVSKKAFNKIIKKNNGKMVFESIDDMKEKMLDKFLYYLSYRAIAPKVIEHMLEAYTIYPAWELTGAHWDTEQMGVVIDEVLENNN